MSMSHSHAFPTDLTFSPKASAAPAIDLVSDFDIVCPPSLSRSELRAAAAAREAELISVAHALLADFGILSSATIQLSHADLREVRFRSSPFGLTDRRTGAWGYSVTRAITITCPLR